ncbi:MAG: cytochrome b562 [Rheinheimera sp.]|nr:cytochrome b562 [Rheinheimera sp.]
MLLLLCGYACAATAVDLEKTMKNMAFQYKQAYQSENSAQMLAPLQHLIELTEQALQADFSAEQAQHYQHGLQQVLSQLQSAHAAAVKQDVALAKQHLLQVDSLRKEYHQQRKVSIWQLLFG